MQINQNLIFQIDAFTDTPFKGNPAAVCLLTDEMKSEWMQNMAIEMNLSETAFVWKEGEHFRLRWFTPTIEIPLCGHATLASVHALKEAGIISVSQKIIFHTLSGDLTGVVRPDGWIELDFPQEPPTDGSLPAGLASACGIESKPLYVGTNRIGYMIDLASEDEVRKLKPNFEKLASLGGPNVMVTARAKAGSKYDFVSRLFGLSFGIPEDPVTGAMHCCLGPYWAKKLNKNSMLAYQASARGGEMGVTLEGTRTLLSGQAVSIFKGTVNL